MHRTTAQITAQITQNPFIQQLTQSIEDDLASPFRPHPYPIPDDLGFVEGSLEGERLVIENRCYQTRQFRKLHLELARVSDRLHILHCVMFPRKTYNLPIFGADLVGRSDAISAAIADLSPVKREPRLGLEPISLMPPVYDQALAQLPRPIFQRVRQLPAWGDIFSPFCLFVSPQTPEEEAQFLDYVCASLTLHCQFSQAAPLLESPQERAEIRAGHRYYCYQQCQNDKTRRILETSFGNEWADRYMKTILFDSDA
ncbi:MAG: phycocyanobilin:ferredoxin oxidoreductase [Synechococcales cyanobacterium RM1_1_8]|nr:phycocyanobilin:ferredoxin oxidoreductase [Synechococcales cyanobacterium RM1_1_8]